jgi:hypothetical protein
MSGPGHERRQDCRPMRRRSPQDALLLVERTGTKGFAR